MVERISNPDFKAYRLVSNGTDPVPTNWSISGNTYFNAYSDTPCVVIGQGSVSQTVDLTGITHIGLTYSGSLYVVFTKGSSAKVAASSVIAIPAAYQTSGVTIALQHDDASLFYSDSVLVYKVTTDVVSPPVADFTCVSTQQVGLPVSCTNTSTNYVQSHWVFSSGTPGTSEITNPTGIIWSAAGTYNITLTVTNGSGVTSIITKSITITPISISGLVTVTPESKSIDYGEPCDVTLLVSNISPIQSYTIKWYMSTDGVTFNQIISSNCSTTSKTWIHTLSNPSSGTYSFYAVLSNVYGFARLNTDTIVITVTSNRIYNKVRFEYDLWIADGGSPYNSQIRIRTGSTHSWIWTGVNYLDDRGFFSGGNGSIDNNVHPYASEFKNDCIIPRNTWFTVRELIDIESNTHTWSIILSNGTYTYTMPYVGDYVSFHMGNGDGYLTNYMGSMNFKVKNLKVYAIFTDNSEELIFTHTFPGNTLDLNTWRVDQILPGSSGPTVANNIVEFTPENKVDVWLIPSILVKGEAYLTTYGPIKMNYGSYDIKQMLCVSGKAPINYPTIPYENKDDLLTECMVYDAEGTVTLPSECTSVNLLVVGGGGAGGIHDVVDSSCGAAGGGSGYYKEYLNVPVSNKTITVHVGGGGERKWRERGILTGNYPGNNGHESYVLIDGVKYAAAGGIGGGTGTTGCGGNGNIGGCAPACNCFPSIATEISVCFGSNQESYKSSIGYWDVYKARGASRDGFARTCGIVITSQSPSQVSSIESSFGRHVIGEGGDGIVGYNIYDTQYNFKGSQGGSGCVIIQYGRSENTVPNFDIHPNPAVQGHSVDFINTSLYYTSCSWDFGDGSTAATAHGNHVYTNPGEYQVTLTVRNSRSTAYLTKTVIITVDPIVAGFTVSGESGTTSPRYMTFTNTSTGGLAPFQYEWYIKINTGNWTRIGTSHDISDYKCTRVGSYSVKLIVYNTWTLDDHIVNDAFAVTESFVTCNFTSDFNNLADHPAPCTVTFYPITTGLVESYVWDFGDDNVVMIAKNKYGPDVPITHVYNPGDLSTTTYYTVTLTASNSMYSETITKENYIFVTPLAPIARFMVTDPHRGVVPFTAAFHNMSQHAELYEWDFGDGTTSYDEFPSHTYTEMGEYTVSLTAINYGRHRLPFYKRFNTYTIERAVIVTGPSLHVLIK